MKKHKSLLALALAGAAVAFTSGCSSTNTASNTSGDENATYRWVSATGWTPITDIRFMNKFPTEWNPVWYSTTTFAVPLAQPENVTVASSDLPQFSETMQPGDVFVEAAGAPEEPAKVKQIILYTPFSGFSAR